MMILPMLRRSLVAAVTLAIAGTAAAQNYDSLTNIKAAQFAPSLGADSKRCTRIGNLNARWFQSVNATPLI